MQTGLDGRELLQVAHLRNDHRFMTQIVSSAIWNHPPPGTLCTLMEVRCSVPSRQPACFPVARIHI